MKTTILALLFCLSVHAAEVPENDRLGNVMGLLSDAAGAVVEVSKKVPATLEAKDFGRAVSRCGGADFLLSVIDEKKGGIVDGKFVAGELTPGKFVTIAGQELETALARFSELLGEAKGVFAKLQAELKLQATKPASERDFKALKRLLADLDSAMKKAHGEFKPPHH